MIYNKEDLQQALPSNYLALALQLRRDGCISDIRIEYDGEVIGGRVLDAQHHYDVEVQIERTSNNHLRLDGECGCRMRYNCQHVAAVLLDALEAGPLASHKDVVLEPALVQWLDVVTDAVQDHRVDQTQAVDENIIFPDAVSLLKQSRNRRRLPMQADVNRQTYADDVQQRLLYVLRIDKHVPWRLKVGIFSARLLKNGKYGKSTPCSAKKLLGSMHAPNFMLATDQSILRDIVNHASVSAYHEHLEDKKGAAILQQMLLTERCYWLEKDQPALCFAGSRPLKACWKFEEQGNQVLGFETVPPAQHVLPLNPPWYVDEVHGTCGALSADFDGALSAVLFAAPEVTPEQVTVLAESILKRELNIPMPVNLEMNKVEHDIRPKACLKLYSIETEEVVSQTFQGLEIEENAGIEVAQLMIQYGPMTVPLDEWDSSVRWHEGSSLVQVRRDVQGEQSFLKHLERIGMAELAQIEPAYARKSEPGQLGFFDEADWLRFMKDEVDVLRSSGWNIEIESGFRFHLAHSEEWYMDVQKEEGVIQLQMGVKMDDEDINVLPLVMKLLSDLPKGQSLDDLNRHLAGSIQLTKLADGRTLSVPEQHIRDIVTTLVELYEPDNMDEEGRLQISETQLASLGQLEQKLGDAERQGDETIWQKATELQNFVGIENIVPPSSFKATLRTYQQEGLNWLQFLRQYQFHGILADDMGLGKTVQTLAHLMVEKSSGRMQQPTLILAPTSLMSNWAKEAERFAPELKTLVLHGAQRHQHFHKIEQMDLVFTTYPLLLRDEEELLVHHYHYLILDEAQVIKNPKAKASQIVRHIESNYRLCLSGTPMENHLGELWSLFHFLMPSFLGSEEQFKRMFRVPIERENDDVRSKALSQRIRPFMLRRTKDKVEKDLPKKTEMIRSVPLHERQRSIYEGIRLSMHQKVRKAVDAKGFARSQIMILDALLKLRQVCCDPRLLDMQNTTDIQESAKLDMLMGMLPEMIEEGRRILIFSQFTSMLKLIEHALQSEAIDYVKLTGSTRNRSIPVDRFQNGEVPVFLISLKAGGVGLNLTSADTVIHYDPWWNPAVEAQATDRAHRIGQNKPVFVYRLLTEGTVEERIQLMQERKRALAQSLYGSEAKSVMKWTSDDLDVLFAPLEEVEDE